MDWSTIIVAIASLLGTCLGTVSGMKLVKYQIEELKKQVERHNGFAERIPVLEEQIKELNREIKYIKGDIDELYTRTNN